METTTAAGQKAFFISNGQTEVSVTIAGGHMAPVRFFADSDSPIEPYYVSPWQTESDLIQGPGVLNPLRGDFFCMPFGGSNVLGDEVHPPHGEVSEAEWTISDSRSDQGGSRLELILDTEIRPGKVVKSIELRDDESNLYISHSIKGFAGPVTLGHHAIVPGDRTHYLSTRPLITGICDTAPPPPSSREYYSAQPGAFFADLSSVPTIWKDPATADYSVFPHRDGFVDILQIFPQPPSDGTPQWITASVPSHGYLWFSLKDPSILPSTVLWQENHGRHAAPWSGRNSCMGVEEVLAHLASGLTISADENTLTAKGLPTSMNLDGKGLDVRNIQGVCRIPVGFDRVADVLFEENKAVFLSVSGSRAEAVVDWSFVLNDRKL